mmetsp:Transcript_11791/g.17564  ORF Transcript_11791/g.17564 Transcript_11791/m.17564 type:complete len:147 (+) Transcript_11791:369-809(+)
MNALQEEFGDAVVCLGFPSNQFGHQTNNNAAEILPQLKHIRPGNGYEPNFPIFNSVDINGANAHPLFTYMKSVLPIPEGETGEMLMADPKFIIWSPINRNDVSWNFEKFLVDQNGIPVKRYSRKFPTLDIKKDIEQLVKQGELVAQ